MSESTTPEARRAAEITAALHESPDNRDHAAVRAYLHRLCGLGLSVLFVHPGAKTPVDLRTARERIAADKAARQAAKAAGNPHWHRARSDSGLALASTDRAVVDRYLAEYIRAFSTFEDGEMIEPAAVNIGVEVDASGLVVIDADTPEQVSAFEAACGETCPVATVSTPGARDAASGEIVHHDGGHWYFTVPEGMGLPEDAGSLKSSAEDGYAALWSRRYVLIPPSTRPEGAYKAVGAVMELPGWLHEQIVEHGRLRAERAARRRGAVANDGPVARWGASITWAEILADAPGWENTGKPDNCGCDMWTAPGAHSSPKSATAHEPGCGRMDSPDPGLNIWTDHDVEPFGAAVAKYGTYLTRLRAHAAIHHDNDTGAAMSALDLHDDEPQTLNAGMVGDGGGQDTGTRGDDDPSAGRTRSAAGSTKRSLRITWASDITPAPVPWLWVDVTAGNVWNRDLRPESAPDPFVVDDIACVAPGRTWRAPEVETDGRIACGMVSIAAGREGSGKSSFGIWLTAKITRGTLPGAHYGTPKRVFYLATEDSWKHTLVPRLMAAGADMFKVARIEVVMQEGNTVSLSLPEDTELLTQEIIAYEVALVVVDPLMSTLGDGLDANGSRDVRTALEPLAAMADRTGASVVGIAHFNKATGQDALSRITGSGAFKDIARAVFVFADDGDERVFTQRKNSVGRYDLPSLTYEIRSETVDTPTGKAPAGVFRFTGIADRSVDEVLDDQRHRKRPRSAVADFIIEYLAENADEHGEVDAAEVFAAGEAKGFTRKQMTDARSRSRDPEIRTRKEGFGGEARNVWSVGEN